MTEDTRGQLIAALTNLKNQNKKSVTLDIDYVLKALKQPAEPSVNSPPKRKSLEVDAGLFKN
jgi:tetrahydromethanopterin S-methyltransferase subunit B